MPRRDRSLMTKIVRRATNKPEEVRPEEEKKESDESADIKSFFAKADFSSLNVRS